MLTHDYLPGHKEIPLIQDDTMLRVNTDTEVLGNFVNIYRENTVLDMGTNNGALLLYANIFTPKKLIGIDINTEALKIAKMNMDNNNITNYELKEANIVEYTADPVDVIICNPPYFKTEENNKGDNKYKALAKHEGILTLPTLAKAISRNLKDNGTLYFLFLSSRMDEVFLEFKKNNLVIKEVQMVFDENKPFSNVFMVKAIKNGIQGMVIKKPIIKKR